MCLGDEDYGWGLMPLSTEFNELMAEPRYCHFWIQIVFFLPPVA